MDVFRGQGILLLASGIAAGILAYAVSSRAVRRERVPATPQEAIAVKAKELSETEAARAGREFLVKKVVPELKPVLIDLLHQAEEYVDHYFERAEKAVKAM